MRSSNAALLAGLIFLAACKPSAEQAEEAAGEAPAAAAAEAEPRLVFEDDFERDDVGDAWRAQGDAWSIDDGWLTVEGARNDALWLKTKLPERVRIEFDAMSMSEEGDLKFEVFGDATPMRAVIWDLRRVGQPAEHHREAR